MNLDKFNFDAKALNCNESMEHTAVGIKHHDTGRLPISPLPHNASSIGVYK